jgi:hypothetical protein
MQQSAEELFDWIVNSNCVRGSRPHDQGCWLQTSAPPATFAPDTRRLTLTDGKTYIINRKTACKALSLDKKNETFLATLPTTLNKVI